MEKQIVNFMPGPVNLHPEVKKIYHDTFLSHRSAKFYNDVAQFRNNLCAFVNAPNVALFIGSGSLGNEVVAQYLKQLNGKGLILINGEFGKRLKEQATYIDLHFDTFETKLGNAFDYTQLEQQVAKSNYNWIWFVNCETSSGILNKIETIKNICHKHQVKVAVDCISTIGNTPVNLKGVYLASGTSGKGLASYAGVAMVYFDNAVLESSEKGIPKYMNLKHHNDTNWVPYTISTNLFYALKHAFEGVTDKAHMQNIKAISDYIYGELETLGFTLLGNYHEMMPGIISVVCPVEINSYELGVELEKNHFYVNYGGAYLRNANYFQICIMGHQEMANANKLVEFLKAKKQALDLQIAS
ncbi:MAG: alanine--glyoxylate aminotransferase family protein [Bacteroidia bacterium]|nr:alanine--glyoxylate aminotransferase family protein [Bacteroidia bacterium]